LFPDSSINAVIPLSSESTLAIFVLTCIILSNKNQQEDIDRGNSLGVWGFIVKANFTPGEVINQVKEVLAKKDTK
jgi:DNA-binding NarL/FixJ family response regulator